MSQRYKGAVITATPPVPTPGNAGTAPGLWTMQQQLQAQGAGTWPSFTPVYIEDVFGTYLYTGNGGVQTVNNGILLGSGQVGTGGSQFFDGNLGRVNMPDSSLFTLGTSWCIEAFIYPVASQTGTIFARWYSPTNNAAYVFYLDGSYIRGGAYPYYNSAGGPVTLNQWSHVAMTYNGSVKRFFVNGTLVASYTEDDSITSTTGQSPSIGNNTSGGAPFPGYISNLRVVSGSPVYTSSFTVPTSPLTAISGTSLLCLQGTSPLIDNSGNNVILTPANGTNASSNGPFNAATVTGKGGLVWIKSRSNAVSHQLVDTARGNTKVIHSNQTIGNETSSAGYELTAFTPSGFSLGPDEFQNLNTSNYTFASWTFRKEPKFFDIQTYTGTGSVLTVNHNLGSTPGCIIIKNYNPGNTDWTVYHRSLGTGAYLQLNNTNASVGSTAVSAVSSTTFTVAGGSANWNSSGQSYVAYIFAHDAGGFGLTGTDNVISCGSVTDSAGATINLGWEPQWILAKRTDSTQNWFLFDTTRNWTNGTSGWTALFPNTSGAESAYGGAAYWVPTATGISIVNTFFGAGASVIYIAIRRGPMRTPTSGSQIFAPVTYTGNDTDGRLISSGFPVDGAIIDPRNGYATPGGPNWFSRLTGNGYFLQTAQTNTETNGTSNSNGIMGQDGITVSRNGSNVWSNVSSNTYVSWFLRRAPSFYDTVCYTGTGANRTVTHNLTVPPELIIVKNREQAGYNGAVYASGSPGTLLLDQASAAYTSGYYAGCFTSTSATTFGLNTIGEVNNAGAGYIAYLFASCPGVSKVGSYTGTGATQTISCGFAARFVLIKRTDSTGNWLVWDTARGMVSGSDFLIALNNTSAETNADWVYTNVSGFQIVTTNSSVNASGGSYIYLAIA